jgi:nucleotide-binding universal stress UspA family protein
MVRKILVPLDGSATAQRGFEEALGMAKMFGASVVLLNVAELYPVMLETASASAWEQIAEGQRRAGRDIVERARSTAVDQGVAADTVVIENPAERVADVVVKVARDKGCDMIVMGTHGRRGFSHLMLGSDAERVLHLSTLPVLVVRHPETQPR